MDSFAPDETATRAVGADLAPNLNAGEVVLLFGELGAGKTTLVRGVLEGLGWNGAVRSPTFSLLHLYATDPPIAHADLYRVSSAEGIGLEDVLEDHIVLVEWPEAGEDVLKSRPGWRVEIAPEGTGRRITIARLSG
ncbi:MAG: tRNA (adenosine(37)-N6)-threonylcarbamoyltransferase complex ATPase subunit type 1 TsaE [Fimbriimonadaceae bacterium]|nr:tRNA (adenosine(37)-N6)-threonylcarbamoyltransferase complex ATPase subunit type 1 TsaE [Fimbriimonadaceae bacterium]